MRAMSAAIIVFAAAAFLTVAAPPAAAHHSFAAEYDSTKPVTLHGAVVGPGGVVCLEAHRSR